MNQLFIDKAAKLMPELYVKRVKPLADTMPEGRWMRDGDSFTLDFGEHLTGYLTLCFDTSASCDSPLRLRLQFAEMKFEYDDPDYNGALSSTWMQDEIVNIDNPYVPVKFPRRYAFQYVKVTFVGNPAYYTKITDAYAESVTSACVENVSPLPSETPERLQLLDDMGRRTLRDCMQLVFEDGPKRDRRLWVGDIYLQAKANYVTFKNYDLVLRCMYLFAGLTHPDGTISSAIFHEPVMRTQAWILHDYAMFFVPLLEEYVNETGRHDVAEELWPVAFRQLEIGAGAADGEGFVPVNMYFVDWCDKLDKELAAIGEAVMCLKSGLRLAEAYGAEPEIAFIKEKIEKLSAAARSCFDSGKSLFVTRAGQVSYASQMWMIMAEIPDEKDFPEIMRAVRSCKEAVDTVSPYAKHYYIESLFKAGMKGDAVKAMEEYWGGMADIGANTFWEVYVPSDLSISPYGGRQINSYCHAWSCTPTYFIRKYLTSKTE